MLDILGHIKRNILIYLIFVLLIIEIIFAAYLIYDSSKAITLCVVGESCDSVQNTQYGYLFGIKLAYLSIFAFTFLALIYFVNKILFLLSTFVGFAFAIYFIIVQLFVLKEICSTCMIIDFIMVAISILATINFILIRKKKDKKKIKSRKK